jgi:serine/threonine-protein kinase
VLARARDELLDHRYRVVRWIGQGAFATVYEVHDTKLDRPAAIKILNTELVASPVLQARFVQEAEAAIHIDSPFIVGVYAVGTLEDGHPYIVMELLDGEDLGQLLERVGPLEEEHAVELAIHALSGIAHAHARGVLHRDIKPDNLVIVRSESGDELLKLVDFGISKLVTERESLGLTRTNAVLGSPAYMSPEQARGAKNMDHRSDVYSLGVVLYECLTGKPPHDGDNFNALMFKIALEDAPDPRTVKPDLDPDLAAIVMKALARDYDRRYPSASAFREALLEWGAGRGARVPPTPSDRMRVSTPRRHRRLEVTLDEEDDAPKAPKPSEVTTTPRALPRLVDSLEPELDVSRGRRKAAVLVVLAALLGVGAFAFVVSSRTAPPPPAAAATTAAAATSIAPLLPPEPPSASAAPPRPSAIASAKPKPKPRPAKPSRAPRKPSAAPRPTASAPAEPPAEEQASEEPAAEPDSPPEE